MPRKAELVFSHICSCPWLHAFSIRGPWALRGCWPCLEAHPLLSHTPDLGSCLAASPLAGQEEFKPREGSHKGTGYKSNYRPVVSNQASLNALDNPAMGYGLYALPPGLLGLSSHRHPCKGTLSPACLGLGPWGTQGRVPCHGPKGLLRHLWEV